MYISTLILFLLHMVHAVQSSGPGSILTVTPLLIALIEQPDPAMRVDCTHPAQTIVTEV